MKLGLFDDNVRTHYGPSLRGETTYSFFDRSAQEWVGGIRDMLQRWLDRVPPDKRKGLITRMRHKGRGSPVEESRFWGAFWELYLHEFLLGTGGQVHIEPERQGLTPDFLVVDRTSDNTVFEYVIEAKNESNLLEISWLEKQVLDIVSKIESPDFFLWVKTHGTLSSMPQTNAIQKPFRELLSQANYEELRELLDADPSGYRELPSASFQHGGWILTGTLWPRARALRDKYGRFIGAGPGMSGAVNDVAGPREHLTIKADRYRDEKNLVLAIRDPGTHFRMDDVLFGSTAVRVYRHNDLGNRNPLLAPHLTHLNDGFWASSKGPINGHVSGVVVFNNVYPWSVDKVTAVYYPNPFTDQPRPHWAEAITHAEYPDGHVGIVEGLDPCSFTSDYEVMPLDGFAAPSDIAGTGPG